MKDRDILRKDKQIGLRLNESEYMKIHLLANYYGFTKSSFVVELIKDFNGEIRRNISKGRREKQISVRLSVKDFEELNYLSLEIGANLQNYIRMILNSVELPDDIDKRIKIIKK